MTASPITPSPLARIALAVALVTFGLAACSGEASDGVASLTEDRAAPTAEDEDTVDEPSDEEAILAFSACMRANGLEDFEDPELTADGGIRFGFGGQVASGDVDRETVRQAMDACRVHLDGLAFGREQADRSEIEDRLIEFAACMRDEGFDMPDPDFSTAGDGEPGGPFGGAIDPDDPEFRSAMAACEDLFEGGVPFGPGQRGGEG
jgi:hypothetical protein